LNLVQRWLAELTTRRLRRCAQRSVAELQADLRAWSQAWTDDPKPLVWTRPPTKSSTTSPDIFNELTTQDSS
jgi:hypothetical protein